MIVNEGGFSAAARRAGLTQPTLSKIVAKLEEELGARLFERGTGSTRPTQTGQLLAERAEVILAMIDDTLLGIKAKLGGDEGKLRIGVGPATRIRPLPGLVQLLSTTYPNLRLEIVHQSGQSLAKSVASGQIDIAFTNAFNATPFGDLLRIKIFEAEIVVAARPGHPLWSSKPLTVRKILAYPMASMGLIPMFHTWSGPLTPGQFRNAESFITDDVSLIPDLLYSTDHISRGPQFIYESEIQEGRLVAEKLDWPERFQCWMLTTDAHWRSPLVQSVASLAKQVATHA